MHCRSSESGLLVKVALEAMAMIFMQHWMQAPFQRVPVLVNKLHMFVHVLVRCDYICIYMYICMDVNIVCVFVG